MAAWAVPCVPPSWPTTRSIAHQSHNQHHHIRIHSQPNRSQFHFEPICYRLNWTDVTELTHCDGEKPGGKTFYSIGKARQWPWTSVMQMAACLKARATATSFRTHCGRKRQSSQKDVQTIETQVAVMAEKSIAQVCLRPKSSGSIPNSKCAACWLLFTCSFDVFPSRSDKAHFSVSASKTVAFGVATTTNTTSYTENNCKKAR